jgi:hypothetical protein
MNTPFYSVKWRFRSMTAFVEQKRHFTDQNPELVDFICMLKKLLPNLLQN